MYTVYYKLVYNFYNWIKSVRLFLNMAYSVGDVFVDPLDVVADLGVDAGKSRHAASEPERDDPAHRGGPARVPAGQGAPGIAL